MFNKQRSSVVPNFKRFRNDSQWLQPNQPWTSVFTKHKYLHSVCIKIIPAGRPVRSHVGLFLAQLNSRLHSKQGNKQGKKYRSPPLPSARGCSTLRLSIYPSAVQKNNFLGVFFAAASGRSALAFYCTLFRRINAPRGLMDQPTPPPPPVPTPDPPHIAVLTLNLHYHEKEFDFPFRMCERGQLTLY